MLQLLEYIENNGMSAVRPLSDHNNNIGHILIFSTTFIQSFYFTPRAEQILQGITGPSWKYLKRDQRGFQHLWGLSAAVQEEIW